MKIAYREEFAHSLPAGHRFPMEKYELLPQQLVLENTIESNAFFAPEPIDIQFVHTIHQDTYINKLNQQNLTRREERKTGFPLSEALVKRELIITEGTKRCCEYALDEGLALNIAGGTHHAYPDHGEGFCLYNDQAIASRWLLDNQKARKIFIIDLDVHQGNGTAAIFQNDPRVFTLSLHGAENYPLNKEKSDLDVPWTKGTADDEYLLWLKNNLPKLIEQEKPDFIFFQAGVDVLENDKLGHLNLTLKGCKERDRIVWNLCKTYEIPVVACMGGGYSPKIKDIIEAHANTFRSAQEFYD